MSMKTFREPILIALAAVTVLGAGCAKKKVAAGTPAPPVQAPAVTRESTPAPRPPSTVTTSPSPSAAAPASRFPNAATRARIDQLLAKISDAYFDYNQHALRPDAIKTLEADSTELRDIL